ncbi:MAG: SDR family oxidoreductase [Candidatus Andersenbacteria bacterium]|nr:SDR family oxidoreductase [Candidatus Andersenbacteria bacterium]MBI3250939.1 SDR family oxidoreductase [Candidatus Andersenbacteria bacterium]
MKTIVVFGAASAIAQASARLWAEEKPRFVLIDRSVDRLKIVAEDLRTRGATDVKTITTDLSLLEKHEDIVQQIHTTPVAIYLVAYGTLGNQKAGEKDFAVARQELTTNFISVASLLTEIINDLSIKKATSPTTIAVISSVAGDRGRQSNYIYGTAKAALTSWLSGLRNRLVKEHPHIHIVTIKPGQVDTPMTADFKKGLLWAKPEDVARDIVHAIHKKRDVTYTPWFWRYIMLIIKLIPERIFKRLTL